MYKPSKRPAFTLIEILVVIGVIALLAALLLAAVQRARESARRAECLNKLKNIGASIHNHVEAHGQFPAGQGRLGESHIVSLLPYLEESALHNALNLTFVPFRGMVCSENATFIIMPVNAFICPSDRTRSDHITLASADYLANNGTFVENFLTGDGPFIGRPLRPSEITDGMSNTVGLSEWIIGPGESSHPSRYGSMYSVDDAISDLDKFTELCQSLDPASVKPSLLGHKGAFWVSGSLATSMYNHLLPPGSPACTNARFQAIGAVSNHGAGVNALNLDGSAHFIKQTISPRVWAALGTRSGQEVANQDLY